MVRHYISLSSAIHAAASIIRRHRVCRRDAHAVRDRPDSRNGACGGGQKLRLGYPRSAAASFRRRGGRRGSGGHARLSRGGCSSGRAAAERLDDAGRLYADAAWNHSARLGAIFHRSEPADRFVQLDAGASARRGQSDASGDRFMASLPKKRCKRPPWSV